MFVFVICDICFFCFIMGLNVFEFVINVELVGFGIEEFGKCFFWR